MKRTEKVEATLTPTEKKIFRALCEEAGCTEAELIRSVLIHREISLENLDDDMQVSDRKKKALHRQQSDFRKAQNAREVDECGEPLAEKRNSKSSVEGQIFQTLSRMEQIRSQESVFDKDCDVYTYDVHDDSILCILRQKGNERFIGIFNFSDSEKTAWMQEEGTFRDLITDQTLELKDVELPAYGFMWCKRM